jgi:hypothetical protein
MSTSKHLGWAHPCNLCTGAEHSRATSALGLGAPLPRSAPGLQMTLRSKHLAALDSTVAGDSDVKLIFGDSTMQASLLGTARKKLVFFPGAFSSGSQRPDRARKHGSGFTRGSIMCCPGRMQSAPSSELATVSSACNTSSSKPAQQTKTPIPIDSIRAAQCLGFKLVAVPGSGPLPTVPAHQCQSSSRVTTIRASWATQRDGARSKSPTLSCVHLLCPWQRLSPVA